MNETVVINLDKFKPLFEETLKLEYELGFNLFYSSKRMSFEISKGNSGYITIPYNSVVSIHTHPIYLYNSDYKPPTHTDYVQSIYDAFKTNPINIVIEKSGMWIYLPNRDLIEEIIRIQPDILDIIRREMIEGETEMEINVGDRLYELIDVIDHNSNNSHQNLILNKEMVIRLIMKKYPEFEEFFLIQKDMKDLLRIFEINKTKISLEEYIKSFNHLVNEEEEYGIGYNVKYIPWSEPFEFNLTLTPQNLLIFRQIKERGLNVFDENDVDNIITIANRTDENRILRK